MAILDNYGLLAGSIVGGVITPQTITGTGNYLGSNVYDTQGGLTLNTGGQAVDLGDGRLFAVEFDIWTSFAGCTSVEFRYVSADNSAMTTNLTELGSTGPIALALLTAPGRVNLVVPPSGMRTIRRYVGVQFVVSGTATAGAVSAAFVSSPADLTPAIYDSGFSIQ